MPSLVLEAPAQTGRPDGSRHASRQALWLLVSLFVLLLLVHVPAFVCMPLDADVHEWDLCARTVLSGGVMYRDALENNFPGMLWLHLGARSLVGWSSPALRALDLALVTAILSLLVFWLPARASAPARLGTGLALAVFYLSTSEWCHCQRDIWMLLPAIAALGLRARQVGAAPLTWSFVLRPVLEGTLWGAAFWIKPFVAVPALACWLSAAPHVGRAGRRSLVLDGLLWVGGGLIAAAAGCAWLAATGAWNDFWEVMWSWNRQYLTHDNSGGQRALIVAGFLVRMFPWWPLHLVAAPLAVRDWWRGRRGDREAWRGRLLAAFYLGWLTQALVLQHLFDYVHAPAVLLALTVLCRHLVQAAPGTSRTVLAAVVVLAVVLRLPALTVQRAPLVKKCLSEGPSAQLYDRLSLLPRESWTDLERTRQFLANRTVRDGELTCWTMRTVGLFNLLEVRPATRYFLLENILSAFVQQRDQVRTDLAASGQRYFVCDVTLSSWKEGQPPTHRLLYQSGPYAVFALEGTSTPAWLDEHMGP